MSPPLATTPFVPLQRTYKKSHFPNVEQYTSALFTCTNLASHTLVRCPRHLTHLPSSFSTTKSHGWCILLSCDSCDSFWAICAMCQNVRSRMTNKKQCSRHHVKYHHPTPGVRNSPNSPNSPIRPPPPQLMGTQSTCTAPTVPAPPLPLPPLPPLPCTVTSPPRNPTLALPFFSRMESQHYFRHNQNGHLGPASLVSLAHFKNRFASHEIPPQHVYNQILVAHHASDLTKGQNKKFFHLLQNLTTTGSIHNSGGRTIPPIPLSFPELRSKFTDGPNSIGMNLPYPAVQTDVRGHCYVKISDVIEDFLAHGFLPLQPDIRQSEDWVNSISQAPQLVKNLGQAMSLHGQHPFYFLAFKEWQDDYESFNARTDRGSVWCKNITISLQSLERHDTYAHTPLPFPTSHPITTQLK